MRVLLVDDSNSVAMVVTQMLQEAGIESIRAKDGRDALEVIERGEKIDLILLDWNMPNMTGIEFLKWNFENKVVNYPIVMMTTENKPENIREALKFGASEYIMKPFTQDILISKINSVSDIAA
jgi:two-component system chemotaxis response regulator CheY